MTGQTVVATANVLRDLDHEAAAEALHGVLSLAPDLVGLQEWSLLRRSVLRRTGSVRVVPGIGAGTRQVRGGAYRWCAPVLGGCPVGARQDRFELLESGLRLLSPVARSERADRALRLEPPRLATLVVYRDRQDGRTVSLLNYHLTPGVQAGGCYRVDRPRLVERHRREVRAIEGLVAEQQAQGHVVYALGDANFDGLRLAGLTSAWAGRESEPGTLGSRRKVDDVFGPGGATAVRLLANDSDHKAVVVTRG